MNAITFSNAMVGTVGAYAEVVAEQARTIEQLQIAIRDLSKTKPPPPLPVQVTAVIDAALEVLMETTDTGTAGKLAKLGEVMREFERWSVK